MQNREVKRFCFVQGHFFFTFRMEASITCCRVDATRAHVLSPCVLKHDTSGGGGVMMLLTLFLHLTFCWTVTRVWIVLSILHVDLRSSSLSLFCKLSCCSIAYCVCGLLTVIHTFPDKIQCKYLLPAHCENNFPHLYSPSDTLSCQPCCQSQRRER